MKNMLTMIFQRALKRIFSRVFLQGILMTLAIPFMLVERITAATEADITGENIRFVFIDKTISLEYGIKPELLKEYILRKLSIEGFTVLTGQDNAPQGVVITAILTVSHLSYYKTGGGTWGGKVFTDLQLAVAGSTASPTDQPVTNDVLYIKEDLDEAEAKRWNERLFEDLTARIVKRVKEYSIIAQTQMVQQPVTAKEVPKAQNYELGPVDVDQEIPDADDLNGDALAVVIGISKQSYTEVPAVEYAARGASTMRQYLLKSFGLSDKRILQITDEKATLAEFRKTFGQKIKNMVRPGVTDVIIYYNGHGAPDIRTQDPFFVPFDCDPTYATQTGYPLSEFYRELSQLQARRLFIFIDACFSGSSPRGMLFSDVSPALLKVKNPVTAMSNALIITSSTNDQLSNWYGEKRHGLFSYFLFKAFGGEADVDKDRIITAGELERYLLSKIPEKARELNKEQTPTMIGDKSQIILKLRK